ncbi:MAG: pyridoxal-dependent decarboxylase [Kiloniellales bacterium]|nr:pyridoxal-dependent decarboxylase [Kiloniellales bacterium]
MSEASRPSAAFAAPDGANREAVGALLGRALDLVLDHMASAGGRPPLPPEPGPTALRLPRAPLDEAEILDGLKALLEASMNPHSPGWMGHMDPAPATASLVGALAGAAVNNNLLSLEMSPAFSRLEAGLMTELGRLFGLPEGCGGVMASGGSLANIHALAVARNRAFPVAEDGLAGLARRPLVFASEAAHTSLKKAAMVLGLGSKAVVPVATDSDGRMVPSALARAIDEAEQGGGAPFAVVATAGTTVTGSFDPLEALAGIAADKGLWFHVDAAYGGAMILSEAGRGKLAGIERADSITFNPQKWLYVAKACACCLFRAPATLERHFRIDAPYMAATGGFTNLGELGLQGTRAAEVLKLWLTLQHLGLEGLGEIVEENLALTRRLLAEIEARPALALAARPDSNLLCFRPAAGDRADDTTDDLGDDPERGDRLTAALQRCLLEAGIFLSLPLYRGRRWLRAVLLNPQTGEAELARLLAVVDEFLAQEGLS